MNYILPLLMMVQILYMAYVVIKLQNLIDEVIMLSVRMRQAADEVRERTRYYWAEKEPK